MPRRTKRPTYVRTRQRRATSKKKKPKVPWRAIRKHNRRRERSNIEKMVYAWLKEDGIPFKQEFAIGRCHVDFLLNDRDIIEVQGCHWHGCMICNKELTADQNLARQKDGRRFAFFRARGYNVVELWECQIKKEPETAQAILRAVAHKG